VIRCETVFCIGSLMELEQLKQLELTVRVIIGLLNSLKTYESPLQTVLEGKRHILLPFSTIDQSFGRLLVDHGPETELTFLGPLVAVVFSLSPSFRNL
jgi:hypothetical protein